MFVSAPRRRLARLVGLGFLLTGLTGVAEAQTYSNPNLPRSPYVLPAPTYREPDVDALADGNGLLHSSGQWRHWGDKRNSGETFQELFAPSGVLGEDPDAPNVPPRSRFCRSHPDQC